MARRFFALALAVCAVFVASTFVPFPRAALSPRPVVNLRVLDRNGSLLREQLSEEGGRGRWVSLSEVSPYLLKATIAAEDRFFFFHGGIDILSTIRAVSQNLRHGHVVSGASTISQQVVRNTRPGRRTIWTKLAEAWLALRLERTLSKSDILVQYLNRIFYGNQAAGIEAAARLYFDKPASQLSLAESALLAAIPRSPSRLNPYRSLPELVTRQRDILRKMTALSLATNAEARRALEERLVLAPERDLFRAPHFCDYVLSRIPEGERSGLAAVVTTLDGELQDKLEVMLRSYLDRVRDRGITNGALVVIDNATAEIRGFVGSRDYFDEASDGQVDGAAAPRQPGSTLKPFTYALALEKGMTAASLIEDVPSQFATGDGMFAPRNYDRKYHGPLTLRAALACSYNVPAVAVLEAVGPDLLYRRLKELGFSGLRQNPAFYGVGLTLGNGEVDLVELAGAYSALARQGSYRPVSFLLEMRKKTGEKTRLDPRPATQVFSPQVAYVITNILADRNARVPSFGYHTALGLPFPVAAKTGTSKDFRDNWTVGYTPNYTVGIWVGDFSGRPMHNVSGITGCGPLFRDVMLLLHREKEWTDFPEPEGITRVAVCPLSGGLPGDRCSGSVEEVFVRGTEPTKRCDLPHGPDGVPAVGGGALTAPLRRIQVVSPADGDVFELDPVLRAEHQRILLRVSLPPGPRASKVDWWVDGLRAGQAAYPYSLFWNLRPGTFVIKATVPGGSSLESRPVRITVLAKDDPSSTPAASGGPGDEEPRP